MTNVFQCVGAVSSRKWFLSAGGIAFLRATANELSVRVPLFGKWEFLPSDVLAIEPYGRIPLLDRGVKIHHSIAAFPNPLIFSSLRSSKTVLQGIKSAGFIFNERNNAA